MSAAAAATIERPSYVALCDPYGASTVLPWRLLIPAHKLILFEIFIVVFSIVSFTVGHRGDWLKTALAY